jgi:hypothetical protein
MRSPGNEAKGASLSTIVACPHRLRVFAIVVADLVTFRKSRAISFYGGTTWGRMDPRLGTHPRLNDRARRVRHPHWRTRELRERLELDGPRWEAKRLGLGENASPNAPPHVSRWMRTRPSPSAITMSPSGLYRTGRKRRSQSEGAVHHGHTAWAVGSTGTRLPGKSRGSAAKTSMLMAEPPVTMTSESPPAPRPPEPSPLPLPPSVPGSRTRVRLRGPMTSAAVSERRGS